MIKLFSHYLNADGLHPNFTYGKPIIADKVAKFISSNIIYLEREHKL